ncbi:MAG: hypothetical protein IKN13_03470 [Bacteroidales bacterium]|nr:hypothetical protein [Bacteroidales bacterium]
MKTRSFIMLVMAVIFTAFIQSCSCDTNYHAVTDPEEKQALRVRGEGNPINNTFNSISLPLLRADWAALMEQAPEKLLEQANEGKKKKERISMEEFEVSEWDKFEYASDHIDEIAGDRYSPALTIYFYLMLVVFGCVLVWKTVKTFIIKPKR